jgi:hypothetical protein
MDGRSNPQKREGLTGSDASDSQVLQKREGLTGSDASDSQVPRSSVDYEREQALRKLEGYTDTPPSSSANPFARELPSLTIGTNLDRWRGSGTNRRSGLRVSIANELQELGPFIRKNDSDASAPLFPPPRSSLSSPRSPLSSHFMRSPITPLETVVEGQTPEYPQDSGMSQKKSEGPDILSPTVISAYKQRSSYIHQSTSRWRHLLPEGIVDRIDKPGERYVPSIEDRLKDPNARELARILAFLKEKGRDQNTLILKQNHNLDSTHIVIDEEARQGFKSLFKKEIGQEYTMPKEEWNLIEKTYLSKREYQVRANAERWNEGWAEGPSNSKRKWWQRKK